MEIIRFRSFLPISVLNVSPVTLMAQALRRKPDQIIINKKGEILDICGNKLGYIDKDGIARNAKSQKIYYIEINGTVTDASGKNLGKATKSGHFYNLYGMIIISIQNKNDEMFEILDSKGHKMGEVHKNYKLHACAAHCFFLKENHEIEKKKSKVLN